MGARSHQWVRAIAILAVLGVFISVVLWTGYLATADADANKTYVDPDGRFSFEIPPGVTVQDFHSSEGSIETLVASGGTEENFQITITPWADATLTVENLLQDYPWLADRAVELITVSGAPGITFEDLVIGTRDVWFATGGYLYQFTIQVRLPAVIESLQLRGAAVN
jgi:hypothetical protein